MRTKLLFSIAVLVLAGCSAEKKKAPPPQTPAVTVAHPLVMPLVKWDRYTGRFRAVEEVEVRSRVSGYLQSIHFAEGAMVKEGDLLFVIDERPFKAELERTRAGIKEAKARLTQAQASLRQATAELEVAKAQQGLARTRLDRAKQAISTNAIAEEQVDVRRSELLQADASVEAAEARIAAAQAGIATATASISTAETLEARAAIDLAYCRISSPIAGRINRHEVTVGNLIDGGAAASTLLTTIVSLDPIHFEFDLNEQAYLKYVRLAGSGQKARSREVKNPVLARLADERGFPHRGHMDFVANRIDRGTGTLRTRAIFANKKSLLLPGLFATIRLPGSKRQDTILLPDKAIGTDQSIQYVIVVDAENRAQLRPVVTGPLRHGMRIIREGVTKDDRVVIGGLLRAFPGTPVQPVMKELPMPKAKDGLPDDYEPLPESEWLSKKPAPLPKEDGR